MRCDNRSSWLVEGQMTSQKTSRGSVGRGDSEEAIQVLLPQSIRCSNPYPNQSKVRNDAQFQCDAVKRTLKSRIKRRRAEVDMMI
jgi:hypothetical protein